jgi:hypothetical protein
MQYITRLKKAGVEVLKHAGHHVAGLQGIDALAQVELTVEVIDQLEDAGLLNMEEVADGNGK